MYRSCLIVSLVAVTLLPTAGRAEDLAKDIKKAVERSTLDQAGTKPFHLKADLAPSFERDKDSGRTGEVEIWWESPTRWRREVHSPEFKQVEIVDGGRDWQKSDGEYFPQWLQQIALALVRPVPAIDDVVHQVRDAEVRRIGPMTSLSWTTPSGTSETQNILRSSLALQNDTGLLYYAGGMGWGAEFKDYADFHGRKVARTVKAGLPQVTAKVSKLEDLGNIPSNFFDATAKDGDPHGLKTVLVDETFFRKNLLPANAIAWPPLQDGPLEGKVSGEVVVDREGKIRQIDPLVMDNPGLDEAGKQAIDSMRFRPFVVDGAPVQVMSQITIPFKTKRPAGAEAFDSAREYFERGRHNGFPAFGNGTAYVLRAEFETKDRDGKPAKGQYEDTWLSETQWRRELKFASSRYVRSRNGDKTYQLADGPDANFLRLVMRVMEPIPAIDTFTESDWKIKRDTINGASTVRVLSGHESPEGKLDPENASAYWFDDTGLLLATFFRGIETERADFADFAGAKVAHRIDIFKDGHLGMRIHVTEISPAGAIPSSNFELKGNEWTRAFTAEAR